jgi:hypothetical protein
LEPIAAPPALPEVVSDGGVAWGEPIEGDAEAAPAGEGASESQPARADSSRRRRSRHRRRRSRRPKKSDNTPPA